MSLHRHNPARDANEPEIVAALEALGASVLRLSQPCDLLVGYRGRNYLLEVKLPAGPQGGISHSQLTDAQLDFCNTWRGESFTIVRSADEALAVLRFDVRRGGRSAVPDEGHW